MRPTRHWRLPDLHRASVSACSSWLVEGDSSKVPRRVLGPAGRSYAVASVGGDAIQMAGMTGWLAAAGTIPVVVVVLLVPVLVHPRQVLIGASWMARQTGTGRRDTQYTQIRTTNASQQVPCRAWQHGRASSATFHTPYGQHTYHLTSTGQHESPRSAVLVHEPRATSPHHESPLIRTVIGRDGRRFALSFSKLLCRQPSITPATWIRLAAPGRWGLYDDDCANTTYISDMLSIMVRRTLFCWASEPPQSTRSAATGIPTSPSRRRPLCSSLPHGLAAAGPSNPAFPSAHPDVRDRVE